MKKLFSGLLVISLLLLFSCSKENNGNNSNPIPIIPSGDIIGFLANSTSTSFELRNDGNSSSSMTWNISISESTPQEWLNLSEASGSLSGGEKKTITLTLKSDLAVGSYSAKLTITYKGASGNDESKSFTVTTNVPLQEVDVRVNAASLEILNPTDQNLAWRIEVENTPTNPSPGDWFDVSPDSGIAEGKVDSDVSLQPVSVVNLKLKEGLKEGSYHSILRVIVDA